MPPEPTNPALPILLQRLATADTLDDPTTVLGMLSDALYVILLASADANRDTTHATIGYTLEITRTPAAARPTRDGIRDTAALLGCHAQWGETRTGARLDAYEMAVSGPRYATTLLAAALPRTVARHTLLLNATLATLRRQLRAQGTTGAPLQQACDEHARYWNATAWRTMTDRLRLSREHIGFQPVYGDTPA